MECSSVHAYICRITFTKNVAYIDWLTACFDKIWDMNTFTENCDVQYQGRFKTVGGVVAGPGLSLSLPLLIIGDVVTLLL